MRAFVTGATGLLGSAVVTHLLERGDDVVALARDRAKADDLLDTAHLTVVEGDLDDVPAFADALEGTDLLVHAAAYFREYDGTADDEGLLRRRNVDATVALLRAAHKRGVAVSVHTSSSGVVGAAADGAPGDETATPAPIATRNRYFASKIAAEMAVDALLRDDAHVVVVRPGFMIGPRDAGPTGGGRLVLDAATGRLPGVPRAHMNTVDARDVAAAILAAADKGRPGERYNVAGPLLPIADIPRIAARLVGVRPPRELPDPVLDVVALASELWGRATGSQNQLVNRTTVATVRGQQPVSSVKAEEQLGFRPRPLVESVRDALAWYADRGLAPAPPAAPADTSSPAT